MVRQRHKTHLQSKTQTPTGLSETTSPTASNQCFDNSGINKMSWATQNKWIILAIASGACAAFNGVFAKLTTTELTTSISRSLSTFLHLSSVEGAFEVVLRGAFFGLNLLFNGVMWTLFTQALAKGSSTTQVSIINTSSNFVLTAFLGLVIFSESLPPLWWLGATLLVAGNVIVGRKDETGDSETNADGAANLYDPVPQQRPDLFNDEDDDDDVRGGAKPARQGVDEDIIDLGDLTGPETSNGDGAERR
ncbi:hypothetical protein SODALDRAFT_348820 [Sodiomyces alkalinus F11]|uniref:EamA domain-containing protein n=1 Tax=Sodiomyces alkalinus (strain CBS 110278 / VKM F-3762 / F11) TaxID=1314773 RepID=A0A3N2Q1I1_SODAK|nr:hypothetical protein SODALDRAFT_348820 [Sodiomyces alkalinus F11]ROT40621.1 hypothetical protein SODALDRAFT_348820 [Sodiomyces alkalinus F11]